MSYGFRAANASGIINVDEDSTTYVYLGKTEFNLNLQGRQDVSINCVGYPLIFIEVPYNVNPETTANTYTYLPLRVGVAMTRLRQSSSNPNVWIVTVNCNYGNSSPGANARLQLRVFGLLHRNFPSGSAGGYGARAWTSAGQLSFDTGFRQLRLAGNTYDTEINVNANYPLTNTADVRASDTSVTLPFSMANKSIMANTRNCMVIPYKYNTYKDFDTGQDINQYVYMYIDTGFWASGNTLYSRKFSTYSTTEDTAAERVAQGAWQGTFSRLAIIDNSLFP